GVTARVDGITRLACSGCKFLKRSEQGEPGRLVPLARSRGGLGGHRITLAVHLRRVKSLPTRKPQSLQQEIGEALRHGSAPRLAQGALVHELARNAASLPALRECPRIGSPEGFVEGRLPSTCQDPFRQQAPDERLRRPGPVSETGPPTAPCQRGDE